jgi:hypothetical protein
MARQELRGEEPSVERYVGPRRHHEVARPGNDDGAILRHGCLGRRGHYRGPAGRVGRWRGGPAARPRRRPRDAVPVC